MASLASLDGTRQFFPLADLDQNEFPAFVEDFLDVSRNINDIFSRNDVVKTMDISVEHFVVPETIPRLLVTTQVLNL